MVVSQFVAAVVGLIATTIIVEQPTTVIEPTIIVTITKPVIAAVIVKPTIIVELKAATFITAIAATVIMTMMAIVVSSPKQPKMNVISYFPLIFSFHFPYFFEKFAGFIFKYLLKVYAIVECWYLQICSELLHCFIR